jgi:hypothetical protein
MEPEGDNKERRTIPSLAHALEEARARAILKRTSERTTAVEAEKPLRQAKGSLQPGSLLDLVQVIQGAEDTSESRSELARLALEANAARRALANGGSREAREANSVQESIDEMRATLGECLEAVRECREMMRTLAARRDRNYF